MIGQQLVSPTMQPTFSNPQFMPFMGGMVSSSGPMYGLVPGHVARAPWPMPAYAVDSAVAVPSRGSMPTEEVMPMAHVSANVASSSAVSSANIPHVPAQAVSSSCSSAPAVPAASSSELTAGVVSSATLPSVTSSKRGPAVTASKTPSAAKRSRTSSDETTDASQAGPKPSRDVACQKVVNDFLASCGEPAYDFSRAAKLSGSSPYTTAERMRLACAVRHFHEHYRATHLENHANRETEQFKSEFRNGRLVISSKKDFWTFISWILRGPYSVVPGADGAVNRNGDSLCAMSSKLAEQYSAWKKLPELTGNQDPSKRADISEDVKTEIRAYRAKYQDWENDARMWLPVWRDFVSDVTGGAADLPALGTKDALPYGSRRVLEDASEGADQDTESAGKNRSIGKRTKGVADASGSYNELLRVMHEQKETTTAALQTFTEFMNAHRDRVVKHDERKAEIHQLKKRRLEMELEKLART